MPPTSSTDLPKRETDYSVGAAGYRDCVYSHVLRGSTVYEQELLLSPDEARQLLDTLLLNMEPDRRIYRYNFLFDNCATRPRDKMRTLPLGRDTLQHGRHDTGHIQRADTRAHAQPPVAHLRHRPGPRGHRSTGPLPCGNECCLLIDLQPVCRRGPHCRERRYGAPAYRRDTHSDRRRTRGPQSQFTDTARPHRRLYPGLCPHRCFLHSGIHRRGRHRRAPDYVIFGLYGTRSAACCFSSYSSRYTRPLRPITSAPRRHPFRLVGHRRM